MDGYGLVVRHVIRPGHEAAFDQLVEEAIVRIHAAEPGTLTYVSHTVAGRPDLRVFYELYRDTDAFQEHERQDHVRAFLDSRAEHVESVEVESLTAISGTLAPAAR